MKMAAFHDAATAWAAAGVAPLPITADGKRPLVKPARHIRGEAWSLELAVKPIFANAAVGFWCGHTTVTVVDVDSAADAEKQHAIDIFGKSPVIVRTASGKDHVD